MVVPLSLVSWTITVLTLVATWTNESAYEPITTQFVPEPSSSLCQISNACVEASHIYILMHNETEADQFNEKVYRCCHLRSVSSKSVYCQSLPFRCSCMNRRIRITAGTFANNPWNEMQRFAGRNYLINTYMLGRKHIDHFVFKVEEMGILVSMNPGLLPIHNIVFQDYKLFPVSDLESIYLNVAFQAFKPLPNITETTALGNRIDSFGEKLTSNRGKNREVVEGYFERYHFETLCCLPNVPKNIMLQSTICKNITCDAVKQMSGSIRCYEELVWTPHLQYAHLNTKGGETWKFLLRRAYPQLFQNTKSSSCPPKKAVILIRSEGQALRKFVNVDELQVLMQDKLQIPVTRLATSSSTDAFEQMYSFNSFGIMVAPHSSQLTNLHFARKNAVVLEMIADGSVDSVFSRLGTNLGLKYHRVYPHEARGGDKQAIKNSDLILNLTLISEYLDSAVTHLNLVCDGYW